LDIRNVIRDVCNAVSDIPELTRNIRDEIHDVSNEVSDIRNLFPHLCRELSNIRNRFRNKEHIIFSGGRRMRHSMNYQ
jgi:hypothetical protein